MSHIKHTPPSQKPVRRQSKSTGTGCLIVTGVLLVGFIIAVVILGLGLRGFFGTGQVAQEPAGLEDNTSPEVVLAQREQDQNRLSSYGWVDKEAEVVRIPIDQAMLVVAEKGLPVGTPTPTPTMPPPTSTPAPPAAVEVSGAETPATEPPLAVSPTPTVDLANVSFQDHVLPIFEQRCIKCHGGERPEGGQRVEEGLKLLTHEDVLTGSWNGPVIEPSDVEDSYLIEQIVTGRMPKEGPRVPPDQIEVIRAWVAAGAPDN